MSDRNPPENTSILILLIDDDPVFRLGLVTLLENIPGLTVVDAVEGSAAVSRLREVTARSQLVMVLEGSFTTVEPLAVVQELRQTASNVPMLLLTAVQNERVLRSLQGLGIEAYLPKGTGVETIVNTLQRLAAGETLWTEAGGQLQQVSPVLPKPPPRWLYNLRRSGLKQITDSLQAVQDQLTQEDTLSTLDWLFWKGRQRELKTAQWLVDQLLPVEVIFNPPTSPPPPLPPDPQESESTPPAGAIVRKLSPVEQVQNKIQFGIENNTGITLELDILRPEKRKELFYVVLQQLEKVLEDLEFLKITPDELEKQQFLIARELWKNSTLTFLRKYYTSNQPDEDLSERIRENTLILEKTRLTKIPFIVDLFSYLLLKTPIKIDDIPYRNNSPEAEERASYLLENLILEVGNGVVQLLLNEFAEEGSFKYTLYEHRFLASREIARLRNELSWQYRQYQYLGEPKAIFESQYRLFILVGNQVRNTWIYAPRLQELESLEGVQWFVTIALESRDAIAPRLRSVVSFVGSGVVYLLTQVLGRAIGLIGQGIIQGLGNTVQERRFRR